MSGPTKAGEPSMEEILASIRKIIADDPSKSSSEASVKAASGPAPSSGSLSDATRGLSDVSLSAPAAEPQRSGPSFGRLSEALRTTFVSNSGSQPSGSFAETRFGQSAPSSPLSAPDRGVTLDPPAPVFGAPTERARSIDSELDDILDEPLNPAVSPEAKKPEDSQWAVWRSPPGKPSDSDTVRSAVSGAAAAPSSPTPSAALGRPSGGFYPSAGGYSPPSALPSSTSPAFGNTGRFEPKLPSGDSVTSSGLGSLVPKRDDDAGKSVTPAAVTRSPRFEPNLRSDSARPVVPESNPESDRSAAKPGTVVIAAMPSATQQAPATKPAAAFPIGASATAAGSGPASDAGNSGVNVPLPPRTTLFSRPFAASKVEAPLAPTAPSVTSTAIPPADRPRPSFGTAKPVSPSETAALALRAPAQSTASAQVAATALDALAAGLAASNAQVTPASTPQVGGTPAVQSPAPVEAVVQAAPPAQQAASPVAAQSRTLEDMVADMVKPMLQKWLTDNMPRIIEKALRSEAGQPGGGGKPPGT